MHFKEVKSILSAKNGINIYRGCTHGCIYCDSRSRIYSMDHKFEDVEIKKDAPELLEIALRKKREKCMIGTGSMSDPYIHLETEVMYTRRCLEVIERYGFGLSIITKSNKILRDLDILKKINIKAKCVVQMTLTTADEDLCKILEPNVCSTKDRFEVLKTLRDNNIPAVVWLTPILPFINDTLDNIRELLSLCVEAKVYGIICFGMGLTLREGCREYFYKNLDEYFPGLKYKYQRRYGYSYQILSENNNELMNYFFEQCSNNHIVCNVNDIFNYLFTFEEKQVVKQMNLFD